jgi:uncharacterized protein (DUF2147 family)
LLSFPAAAQVTTEAALRAPPVVGTWRTLTGTEINVQPCGERFCGTFSFIVIPPGKDSEICRAMAKKDFASVMLDYKNPDKALRNRPLLGLQAMTLVPTGEGNGYAANIYNAEEGKAYDVDVLIRGDTLVLSAGCFAGLCAVTQEWPRVPDREAPDFLCEGG